MGWAYYCGCSGDLASKLIHGIERSPPQLNFQGIDWGGQCRNLSFPLEGFKTHIYNWREMMLMLIRLSLFLLGATIPALAHSAGSTNSASAKKLNWDDAFEGVVHDANKIGGFVGEYRWLSNYFPCSIEWESRVYGSTEAAYHSGKYPAAERDVFTRLDPDHAKKFAHVKPYDTAAWKARKLRTMREVTWAKFSQHPELAKKLLATGDRYLEETNWWSDKFWGVFHGEGQNFFGKILMDTRARLSKEMASAPGKPH
jgi:ribA/ribD-fused uncharacterized protein